MVDKYQYVFSPYIRNYVNMKAETHKLVGLYMNMAFIQSIYRVVSNIRTHIDAVALILPFPIQELLLIALQNTYEYVQETARKEFNLNYGDFLQDDVQNNEKSYYDTLRHEIRRQFQYSPIRNAGELHSKLPFSVTWVMLASLPIFNEGDFFIYFIEVVTAIYVSRCI